MVFGPIGTAVVGGGLGFLGSEIERRGQKQQLRHFRERIQRITKRARKAEEEARTRFPGISRAANRGPTRWRAWGGSPEANPGGPGHPGFRGRRGCALTPGGRIPDQNFGTATTDIHSIGGTAARPGIRSWAACLRTAARPGTTTWGYAAGRDLRTVSTLCNPGSPGRSLDWTGIIWSTHDSLGQ
jgi:hypothetical protein